VAPGKALWVYTSGEVERQAAAEGLLATLDAAGAEVLAQTCAVMSPLPKRFRTLMTDSGKYASYLPSEHGVELVYGGIDACVQAVAALQEGIGA